MTNIELGRRLQIMQAVRASKHGLSAKEIAAAVGRSRSKVLIDMAPLLAGKKIIPVQYSYNRIYCTPAQLGAASEIARLHREQKAQQKKASRRKQDSGPLLDAGPDKSPFVHRVIAASECKVGRVGVTSVWQYAQQAA